VQKTSKSDMMTSYIWHCFCTYCTKNTGVYYISALSRHTAPVGHNSVLSKTKSIRPRLRPRPKLQDQDQDRGRSETSLVIRPRSQTPRLAFVASHVLILPRQSPVVVATVCRYFVHAYTIITITLLLELWKLGWEGLAPGFLGSKSKVSPKPPLPR